MNAYKLYYLGASRNWETIPEIRTILRNVMLAYCEAAGINRVKTQAEPNVNKPKSNDMIIFECGEPMNSSKLCLQVKDQYSLRAIHSGAVYMIPLCRDATKRGIVLMYWKLP